METNAKLPGPIIFSKHLPATEIQNVGFWVARSSTVWLSELAKLPRFLMHATELGSHRTGDKRCSAYYSRRHLFNLYLAAAAIVKPTDNVARLVASTPEDKSEREAVASQR